MAHVNSMTGYARLQGETDGLSWSWEAKSVNGRGLDVRLRLPPGWDALEAPARDLVAKTLKRGNLSLGLTLTQLAQPQSVRINEDLLARYAALAEHLAAAHPTLAPARIDGLMALRGVIDAASGESSDTDADTPERRTAQQAALLAGLAETLAQLAVMRAQEGARLAAVLTAQLDDIATLAEQAAANPAISPAALRDRLLGQLKPLLEQTPPLPEDRLAQEVALLASKGDIREELDRLRAHGAAARDMLASGDAIGRKLDFLCQEFNREANTLCSKANDVALTRTGLALKAVIEQFREQVQNIE